MFRSNQRVSKLVSCFNTADSKVVPEFTVEFLFTSAL